MLRSQKGFTIIELLIAMAIALIILPLGYMMIFSGTKAHVEGINEYQIQSDMRIAAEHINRIARFSTVLFAITETDFKPDTKPLTAGWNYIGTCPVDGIVQFTYNSSTNSHTKTILIENRANIEFSVEFKDSNPDNDDKLVHFALKGHVVDVHKDILIESELQALNSLQIVDRGHEFTPSIALAYRSDPRPVAEISHAAVAMVMDTSGSMAWGMGGKDAPGDMRIDILKNVAKDFIEQLDSSSVSLVPFSTTANSPYDFRDVETSKATLNIDINLLDAVGGTNTGDGLRRGFYQIVKINDNKSTYGVSDKDILNYMIILVDGVTTMASASINVKSESGYWLGDFVNYIDDDSDIGDLWYECVTRNNGNNRFSGQTASGTYEHYGLRRPVGHGSNLDAHGVGYVNLMGGKIKNSTLGIKAFVIGFSALPAELLSVSDIASATGATSTVEGVNYYIATNEVELQAVFEDIGGQILDDLWHVSGP